MNHAGRNTPAGAPSAPQNPNERTKPTEDSVSYVTIVDDAFAEPPQRKSAMTSSQMTSSASTPQRILVVDDDHDAADSLAALLTHQGHTVRQAYEGEAALEIASSFVPDLVFLDLTMPETDGFEVAAGLREMNATRNAKIVALTANGEPSYREATREAQFDAHLLKPLMPSELATVIAWTRIPYAP